MSELSDTMFARPPIYASAGDARELERLAQDAGRTSPGGFLLREEVRRLQTDPPEGVAYLGLGGWAAYRDLRTKRERQVRIVRPEEADPEENHVSVLSPLGAALIGLAEGAIFRWAGPDGRPRAVKLLETFPHESRP